MAVFPPDFVGKNSAKNIALRAKTLGISFHGSAVGDNVARALLNVAPFVIAPEFQKAFRAFEDVSCALNDQTKFSLLLHICTKTYGKTGVAATEAAVALLYAWRAGLVYKDIKKDTH